MTENINSPTPIKEVIKQEYYTSAIYMKDRRVAKGSNNPGTSIPLESLINGKGMNMTIGNEKYPVDKIFFRTESGNIYGIRYSKDKGGEIISARDDVTSSILSYDPKTGESLKLCIGEPLYYSDKMGNYPLHSSKVIEVLAISKEKRSDTIIHNMSGGRESSILTDFQKLKTESKK